MDQVVDAVLAQGSHRLLMFLNFFLNICHGGLVNFIGHLWVTIVSQKLQGWLLDLIWSFTLAKSEKDKEYVAQDEHKGQDEPKNEEFQRVFRSTRSLFNRFLFLFFLYIDTLCLARINLDKHVRAIGCPGEEEWQKESHLQIAQTFEPTDLLPLELLQKGLLLFQIGST